MSTCYISHIANCTPLRSSCLLAPKLYCKGEAGAYIAQCSSVITYPASDQQRHTASSLAPALALALVLALHYLLHLHMQMQMQIQIQPTQHTAHSSVNSPQGARDALPYRPLYLTEQSKLNALVPVPDKSLPQHQHQHRKPTTYCSCSNTATFIRH